MGLLTIAAASVITAGGAVVAAPVVLGAIGFTSIGIAAGSYAAGMMSTAAIANGGGVAAGSLVALLQLAGGVATVALTPALLAALGFTTTGIAAGSIAAKMMSSFTVFYGGGIPAGGLVATLQSIGMTGLGWFGTGAVAGAGSTVGWMVSKICNVNVTVQDNP
ncbi:interferon alpha-inducible protein 27, mitochondrial-like [Girardinichthys multiradiatus]|uniref:interferon alpha-inducible protein 27, mitochondrial-like n=1 Tax=Girardinichthys multiradiatus TaxID=208333 RepID=UPI001FAC1361|nr:interferon alpha-inducible protein 27, mitochondrial-like [Girardinichthys multiradiatus]